MGILPSFLGHEAPPSQSDLATCFYEAAVVVTQAFARVDQAAAVEDPELINVLRQPDQAQSPAGPAAETNPKTAKAREVAQVISRKEHQLKAQGVTPVVLDAATREQLRREDELADIRNKVSQALGEAA
jgi:hypothetical protein